MLVPMSPIDPLSGFALPRGGGRLAVPLQDHGFHQHHPFATIVATAATYPPHGGYGGAGGCKFGNNVMPVPKYSLIGQSIADIVDQLFSSPEGDIVAGGAAVDVDLAVAAAAAAAADTAAAAAGGARAEFSIVWPPTFPIGGSAEVVELRAALSLDAAAAAEIAGAAARAAAAGAVDDVIGAEGVLGAAASGCCARLLAVRDDGVVVGGDEAVKISSGGKASARLRLHADHPGVTSCILTGEQGIPTLEAIEDAAPLIALPQAARDEAHRLLWSMMHEALPPNHSVLPYDPDAFRSPVDFLPPRLQAALSWAWSHHFRAFAHDFSYLLDCTPSPAVAAAAKPLYGSFSPAAAGDGCINAVELYDDVAHYQSVLAQMVCFLRDNDMFACLATLLQTAVARGLTLVGDPSSAVASPLPLPPASSSTPPRSPAAAAALAMALAAIRGAAAARSANDVPDDGTDDDDDDDDDDDNPPPVVAGGVEERSWPSACDEISQDVTDGVTAEALTGFAQGEAAFYIDTAGAEGKAEKAAAAAAVDTADDSCSDGAAAVAFMSEPQPRDVTTAAAVAGMALLLLAWLSLEMLIAGALAAALHRGAVAAVAAVAGRSQQLLNSVGYRPTRLAVPTAVILVATLAGTAAAAAVRHRHLLNARGGGGAGADAAWQPMIRSVLMRMAGAALLAGLTWWAAAAAAAQAASAAGLATAAATAAVIAWACIPSAS